MNRYKLSKAGVDVNDGVRRLGGNREVYQRLLFMFPEDPNYDNMIKAIDEKNVADAFTASHSLKGVAGNLSLVDLHAAILPLVEVFRAGGMDGYDKFLPEVEKTYKAAAEEIAAQRASEA